MLGNLEGISLEAAFILKDLHRHMDDPIVVRRLRDVGQKFSANRRTVVLTAPKIEIPAELGGLVEFLELPLTGPAALAADHRRDSGQNLQNAYAAAETRCERLWMPMAESLRGLTEEEAERALSQALVTRYALCPEIATDVLEAKKTLLKRSEMVEFVEAGRTLFPTSGEWIF